MFEKKSSIDKPLLFLLLALFAVGLTALYSAGGEARFYQQLERGGGAILFMFYPVPYSIYAGSKRLRYLFFLSCYWRFLPCLALALKSITLAVGLTSGFMCSPRSL